MMLALQALSDLHNLEGTWPNQPGLPPVYPWHIPDTWDLPLQWFQGPQGAGHSAPHWGL